MSALRVLIIHNHYRTRGGEDSVFAAESDLLRSRGVEVRTYTRDSHEAEGMNRLSLAVQAVWSRRTIRELGRVVREYKPHVAHLHNIFPLISPSAIWALKRAGVPVVQTLHNFRYWCLNGLLLRDGKVCEDCLGRSPWRGVRHRCYQGSLASSLGLYASIAHLRVRGIMGLVDRFLSMNEFTRDKQIECGLDPERIVLKPNAVPDAPLPNGMERKGFLYVGRLSAEKGVDTLLAAAARCPERLIRVAGDGPMLEQVRNAPGVDYLGLLTRDQVRAEMDRALGLVMPSILYENCPMSIVEAMSRGLAVITSNMGAMGHVVCHGRTGLLFTPGDAEDLCRAMDAAEADQERTLAMGRAGREEFEKIYSEEANFRSLMDIYAQVAPEAVAGASGGRA